jgi:hypothetical protein
MADPTIKIKRGTGKPPNWNGISGATAGELYVDFNNTSFYIGNTFGQAITFGHLVDGGTLGTNSDIRIPTQKAAKTYIDAKFSSIAGLTSTDIIFVRGISSSENSFGGDEELSNTVGIGTVGNVSELPGRWEVFNFNIEQSTNKNIFKTRGSNSIFKMGLDVGSPTVEGTPGGSISQTSASTIKAFVSYQISFDNYTNTSVGGASASSVITTRRCAVRIRTYTDSVNYNDVYMIPSTGISSPSHTLILNGSGIIDMPRWNSDGILQAGVGFIDLVWSTNGISSLNNTFTSGNNYYYAGRSTTNSSWAPNHVTVGNLAPGYTTRLIVAKLPI